MALQFSLIHENQNHTMGTVGPVAILLWHKETTTTGLEMAARAMEQACRSSPSGTGVLAVVAIDSVNPTDAQRKQLADALGKPEHKVKIVGVAVDGTVLRASAIRSISTNMAMLAGGKFPMKTYGSVKETAEWVAGTVSAAAPAFAGELAAVIDEQLRRTRGTKGKQA